MRKVLCSIGVGAHEALIDLSGETFELFADRHGYELDLRRELLAPDRPASWSKILLFRELLTEFDLLVWVDADAAIVDPTLDIADELGDRDLMGVVAHRYDGQEIPNCGVWVLRRHRRVRAFLDRVWKRTEFVDHDWWENAAVLAELGYDVEPTVRLRRRRRMFDRTRLLDAGWNSIALDPAPHPRINHYPGRSQEDRIEHLRRDVATARAVVAELAHPSLSPRGSGSA